MKKPWIYVGLAAAVMLAGCASYQPGTLMTLDLESLRDCVDIDGMKVGCKVYSQEECLKVLDRNLIAQGYQPIQLTFCNETNKRYVFSTDRVSLPCTKATEVARTVHTSTLGRVLGYGIAGMVFWPLLVPAAVDGIKSSNANQALDKDFSAKGKDHFIIEPHSSSETLIFVAVDQFSPVFEVRLFEEAAERSQVVRLSTLR